MQKFDFSYDEESDNLFLFNPKSKSKGSVELGPIVLDYNNKKEFVGIQIFNASQFLKDISGGTASQIKKLLSELKECNIDVKPKNNLIIIQIFLLSETKEISPIFSIPSITESSPALAYA